VKSHEAILLDAMAQRYGQRPSQIIGLCDPWQAYCFDQAIALRGILHEHQEPTTRHKTPAPSRATISGGRIMGKISGVVGEWIE